ncbi:MAG: 30S ribosomal protein S5 [Parcubacteria group bacterium]|nr:30S ribosomal protein S5 [Parcubacteria group bacterium]
MARINKKIEGEFEQNILDIARVTRVVAGGKRLSFRATVAIGLKNGHQIGVGIGKGADVSQAIEKAVNEAKRNLIEVPVVNGTIPFEVAAKYQAARVILKPAKKGKGIIAGGSVRSLLKLANINDVTAKILGQTSNAINNSRATILALKKLSLKE